jgi:hypothetical protein
MGKLIDLFKNNSNNYSYGCNNYIPNYNSTIYVNNSSTINPYRTPEAAFMGYNGDCEMYGLHIWDGNYNFDYC